MSDILERIVAETRRALAEEPLDVRTLQRQAERLASGGDRHRFHGAIADPSRAVHLIAEIKSASPSAGTIVENPDVEAIARDYARGGASAISVVTEPRYFRGELGWISRASHASSLPALMKDFIVDEGQVLRGVAAGADAVLLLASILDRSRIRDFIAILHDFGRDAVVEVHDVRELEEAVEGGAAIVGVNNRNLRDFSVDLATCERLIERLPPGVLRVAESGIRNRGDIERLLAAGFGAFLVGESVLRASDRVTAVRTLADGGAP